MSNDQFKQDKKDVAKEVRNITARIETLRKIARAESKSLNSSTEYDLKSDAMQFEQMKDLMDQVQGGILTDIGMKNAVNNINDAAQKLASGDVSIKEHKQIKEDLKIAKKQLYDTDISNIGDEESRKVFEQARKNISSEIDKFQTYNKGGGSNVKNYLQEQANSLGQAAFASTIGQVPILGAGIEKIGGLAINYLKDRKEVKQKGREKLETSRLQQEKNFLTDINELEGVDLEETNKPEISSATGSMEGVKVELVDIKTEVEQSNVHLATLVDQKEGLKPELINLQEQSKDSTEKIVDSTDGIRKDLDDADKHKIEEEREQKRFQKELLKKIGGGSSALGVLGKKSGKKGLGGVWDDIIGSLIGSSVVATIMGIGWKALGARILVGTGWGLLAAIAGGLLATIATIWNNLKISGADGELTGKEIVTAIVDGTIEVVSRIMKFFGFQMNEEKSKELMHKFLDPIEEALTNLSNAITEPIEKLVKKYSENFGVRRYIDKETGQLNKMGVKAKKAMAFSPKQAKKLGEITGNKEEWDAYTKEKELSNAKRVGQFTGILKENKDGKITILKDKNYLTDLSENELRSLLPYVTTSDKEKIYYAIAKERAGPFGGEKGIKEEAKRLKNEYEGKPAPYKSKILEDINNKSLWQKGKDKVKEVLDTPISETLSLDEKINKVRENNSGLKATTKPTSPKPVLAPKQTREEIFEKYEKQRRGREAYAKIIQKRNKELGIEPSQKPKKYQSMYKLDENGKVVRISKTPSPKPVAPAVQGSKKYGPVRVNKTEAMKRNKVSDWKSEINQYASKHGVPPEAIGAIMQKETGGQMYDSKGNIRTNKNATSVDTGLMQFNNRTVAGINKQRAKKGLPPFDPNNPKQSIEQAAILLKQNYKATGNWPDAMTAYNTGVNNTKSRRWINQPSWKHAQGVKKYRANTTAEMARLERTGELGPSAGGIATTTAAMAVPEEIPSKQARHSAMIEQASSESMVADTTIPTTTSPTTINNNYGGSSSGGFRSGNNETPNTRPDYLPDGAYV